MPDTNDNHPSKPSSVNFSRIPPKTPSAHKTTPKRAAEFYRDDSHSRRRYRERKREKGRQRAFNDLIEDETRDYSLDDDAYSEDSTSNCNIPNDGSSTDLQSHGPTSLEPTPIREETRPLKTTLSSPTNQSTSAIEAEADIQVRRMAIETDERLISETFSGLSRRVGEYGLGAVKNILSYYHSIVELGSGMSKPFCRLLGRHPRTRGDQSQQAPPGHTSEEIPDTRCTKPAPRAEAMSFNRTHWSCCHPCQDAESGRCGFRNTMGMNLCHRTGCNHIMCETCGKPWVVKPLPEKGRRTSGESDREEEEEENEV